MSPASLLVSAAALADINLANPDAKAHWDKGLELYKDKDYGKAAEEFKEAYKLEANPYILYNWAQVRRLGGDCTTAETLYTQFLGSNPPWDQAQAAQQNLQKCKDILSTQEQPTPPVPVKPEPPQPVKPQPTKPPPQEATTSHGRPWYADALGDSLTGVGIVGVGVGIAFFAASGSAQSQASSATTYQAYASAISRAQSQRTVAITGLVAGGALIAGGIIRYVTRSSGESPGVSLWTDGKSGGLVAFGSF